jgi:hypothetical protein
MPLHRFPPLPVVGTVSLWGRVIQHERGWRAQFAYPDRLRLVCSACLAIGEGWGDPDRVVELDTDGSGRPRMSPLCRDHLRLAGLRTRIVREAAQVQSELLSRYAVDLLPIEAVASLFQRAPVPGPGSHRPSASGAQVVAPQPVHRPTPTPAETIAIPSRTTRAVRSARKVVNAIATVAFWLLIGWWGCSDMFVRMNAP